VSIKKVNPGGKTLLLNINEEKAEKLGAIATHLRNVAEDNLVAAQSKGLKGNEFQTQMEKMDLVLDELDSVDRWKQVTLFWSLGGKELFENAKILGYDDWFRSVTMDLNKVRDKLDAEKDQRDVYFGRKKEKRIR